MSVEHSVLFAEQALLPRGWAGNVRLTVSEGRFVEIETDGEPGRSDRRLHTVVPGLCNAHSHAFQRALTGRTERHGPDATDSFWTWRRLMYALANRITPDDLQAIARQLYTEMLASGYTSVVEFHYLHGARDRAVPSDAMLSALLAAAAASGIQLTYVPVLYERSGFGSTGVSDEQATFALSLDNYLAHYDDAAQRLDPAHSIGMAAHSLRAVSRASLEILATQAEADKVPLHLHVAEQPQEVERSVATRGARPVRWLLDNFAVDERWTLVHATHLDDDEVRLLAESSAVTCLCPTTEANLGDGLFRLKDYLELGGAFSIGSDSHVSVNPFEELRWLEYGQRLKLGVRNVAASCGRSSGETLFLEALAGGARSSGQLPAGLSPGAVANLVTLKTDDPALAGHGSGTLIDALVFAGLPAPIDRVMVNGEWVVEDGRHRSAPAAAADFRATVERLALGSGLPS